jgi:superoxide dismutase, Cu-Zn family
MMRIGRVMFAMLAACSVGEVGMQEAMDKQAMAPIAPTTGNTVTGTAAFTLRDGKVTMLVTLANAPEGSHGFHIHQNPACGADGMDAGAHWDGGAAGDPTTHGLPDSPTHHSGDTGNITIAADGTGTMMAESTTWTIGGGGITDVVNHAVIFHLNADDGTMASAGARLGCGVIAAQ